MCVACTSLFVLPFVLELSGRVLRYSDKLWNIEQGWGGSVEGLSPSSLPTIVSTSSVVSPKSPLPRSFSSPEFDPVPSASRLRLPTTTTIAHPSILRPFVFSPRFHSLSLSFSLSTSFTLRQQAAGGTF